MSPSNGVQNFIPVTTTSERMSEIARKPRPNQPLMKLTKTRKCNPRCKIYDRCRFMKMSAIMYEGRCALANTPDMEDRERLRLVRTLIGDRSDMCQNLRDLVDEMENVTDKTDSKEYERLINTHVKVMDAEFGRKLEVKSESVNYNFNMNSNIERAFIERQQKEKDEKVAEGKIIEGECVDIKK